MASQLAPRGLLKTPREATGEQFALLNNKCRCREVGGPSHCTDLRKGALKNLIRMTGGKTLRRLMLLPYMSKAGNNAKQEPFNDHGTSRHNWILRYCHYLLEQSQNPIIEQIVR